MLTGFIHKKGFGFSGMTFGVMDGVLAVLSILIGIGSVVDKYTVFAAMIIVGLADAMANAAGMRVSQETTTYSTKSEIFRSMLFAFISTFFVVIALTIPLILFDILTATIISTFLGIMMLSGLGVFVGIRRLYNKKEMLILITEYVITGLAIILISHTLQN
jgi:hypothetical protein